MFSGSNELPDNKKTELESNNQEASPSAGKNTRVFLVPCPTWKEVCPYSCLLSVDIVMTDELSTRVTKITSRIGAS